MGRLIDADNLLKDVEKSMADNPHTDGKIKINHSLEHQHFVMMVARQPTAYDVERVVEELDEEWVDIVTEGDATPIHHWNGAIEKAIEIVRGGGQSE